MKTLLVLFSVLFALNHGVHAADANAGLIADGAKVEVLGEGYLFTEGPAVDRQGNVFFTDQPNDRIVKYNAADGSFSDWLKPAGRSNGTFFDKDGNLVACADEKNELRSISPDKKVTVLPSDVGGKLMNGPNDLWIRPDGNLHFTDPFYKRDYWKRDKATQQPGEYVYFFDVKSRKATPVATDLKQPNGIIGTPDGKTLYVADIAARKTYAFAADDPKPLTEAKPAQPATERPSESSAPTAQVLPGNGLAQHDFLYAGESKNRRAFIIRKGKVVWSYDDPAGRGEISDAVLLSNGNLLLAHQFAVKLISPEKKVLWNLDAPKGTEIHTAMPIGNEHVLFVQNGDPALVKLVNIKTGETKKEFQVPVGNPKGVHGQFRHGRITERGTLLLAHMDMKRVCEYDANGKEVSSFPAANPWGVTPLKNGNILIVDRPSIREVTLAGETVATITPSADSPDFKLNSLQMAWRLPNGNTLVNNWFNEWSGKLDRTNPPVQAVEFTPDKKIVWVLRSWENPDLGPSTTVQILDEIDAPEKVTFGDIK